MQKVDVLQTQPRQPQKIRSWGRRPPKVVIQKRGKIFVELVFNTRRLSHVLTPVHAVPRLTNLWCGLILLFTSTEKTLLVRVVPLTAIRPSKCAVGLTAAL